MTRIRPAVLAGLTATALVASLPVQAQQSLAYAPGGAQYHLLSDQQLLDRLVAEARRNPAGFKTSLAYVRRHRPALEPAFLKATGVQTVPASGAADGQIFGVIGAVGALVFGLAMMGGGGSDGGEAPAPLPAPDPTPPEGNQLTGFSGDARSFRTPEYRLNYGLEQIGAAARYAEGLQGQGVRIAVMDTGIDVDNVEFAGRIDLQHSYSYFSGSNGISDSSGHGTHVAGILAAAKNDLGSHGVAFGSDLVVLKGIQGSPDERATQEFIWANAIERSVIAGAAVMNNSWAYVRTDSNDQQRAIPITDFATRRDYINFLGSPTIRAFDRAVAGDLLIVSAAGNDGAAQVSANSGVPALLSEYDGYFIATVATDENARIASYSNRCGIAMDFCLAAPGSSIASTRDGGGVAIYSGTSMATPHVAGAAAVLRSQNPELTAPEVATILFDTATDLGDKGVDPVYGRGLLNLAEARAPQGALTIYEGNSVEGASSLLSGTGIAASSAIGPALSAALAGQRLMVGDRYDRGFQMGASALVASAAAPLPVAQARRHSRLSAGLTVVESATGQGVTYADPTSRYHLARGVVDDGDAATSPLAFTHPGLSGSYATDVAPGLSLSGGFSTATGDAQHLATTFGVEASFGGASLGAEFGRLAEQGAVLGSRFSGAAGGAPEARTSYLQVSARFDLDGATALSVSGTRSATDFSQRGLVTGGHDMAGSSARIALSREGLMGVAGTFTASVSAPLQITSGALDVDLPQARSASVAGMASTGVERQQATLAFESPDRPVDIGFSYESAVGTDGPDVAMNVGYRVQSGASHPFMGFSLSHRF